MTERKIDHAAEAMVCIKAAHRTDDGTFTMIQAQVHATLALVEQQRIANLLAMWALPDGSKVRIVEKLGLGEVQENRMIVAIQEGLGLA